MPYVSATLIGDLGNADWATNERIEFMATVDEIVAAAKRLQPDEWLRLRKRLDRLEQRLWSAESRKAGKEMKAAGVTDRDIDRIVMRRRRESRR